MLFYISIFFIPLAIWIILRLVAKSREAGTESDRNALIDECALCHQEFPITELLEKEVGDYNRVYCFCGACIEQLRHEYKAQFELQNEQMGNHVEK